MSKPRLVAGVLVAPLIACCSHLAYSQSGPPAAAPAGSPAQALPDIEVTAPKVTAEAKPHAKKKIATARPKTKPASPPPVSDAVAPPTTPPTAAESFAPTAVTTGDIASTQGATLTDALAEKPGVSGSAFAPGANRPILRGLDNNRVRVQEGGIGAHDVSALSEDHAVPIDPFAAERIDVIRGPEALRYGGPAMGGVVSVENDRVPSQVPASGVRGRVVGGLTSVDDGRDGAFQVTAGGQGLVLHADAFRRSADDYGTPRGLQANSFVDSDGFAVGSSLVGASGFAGVALIHFESTYGIPASEENSRIDLSQDKILSKGEWRIGHGIEAVRYWFGASDYAHDELLSDGAVGSRFTNTEQEGRVEVQHAPVATGFGPLSGMVGGQVSHGNVAGMSFEGDNLLEPADTGRVAGFIFEELGLSRTLRLQAAARLERTTVDGVGLEDPLTQPAMVDRGLSFVPVSRSLGAVTDLPLGVVGRLSAQWIERAPEAAELFSKGAHEATETFEIGDPDLATERAKTLEIGLKRSQGRLRFEAAAYATHFDRFIFKELTGVRCGATLASCGVEDDLDQVVFRQTDATFYGAELAAQYDVAPIWSGVWGVDGQYDIVRAELANGENVPRIAPQRLGGGLYYRDGAWRLRAGVLHAFDQDRNGVNETPTPGYTLVSAEASYTTRLSGFGSLTPETTIGIKGENLTDDDVRLHTSFKKDEVLQPGASVRVFGTVKLN